MIWKYAVLALVSTAMSFGAATAQSIRKVDGSNIRARAAPSDHERHWRSSKLIGLTVYNVTNEKIGIIQDFIVDRSAGVDLVVIDVSGALQMDERNLAVGFKLLKWVNTPVGMPSRTNGSQPATTWMIEPPKTDVAGAPREGQWYPDHAVLAATKSQLKNMRTFEY